jgi:hypothetical protein
MGDLKAVEAECLGGLAPSSQQQSRSDVLAEALKAASSRGHEAVVRSLLLKMPDDKARASAASGALCPTVQAGHLACVSALLKVGNADPDQHLLDGSSALMLASEAGSLPLTLELLEHNSKLFRKRGEHTALSLAARGGHARIVCELLAAANRGREGTHADGGPPVRERAPTVAASSGGGWTLKAIQVAIGEASKHGHGDIVPALVGTVSSRWRLRAASSLSVPASHSDTMRVQWLLHMLDPLESCGVRLVLLNEVLALTTGGLCVALADSFWHHPLEALSDAVFLSHAFDSEARQVQGTEPSRADHLMIQSTRVQHVACGLIRALTRPVPELDAKLLDELLYDSRASRMLLLAVDGECKIFLSLPELQHHLSRRWAGSTRVVGDSPAAPRRLVIPDLLVLLLIAPLALLSSALIPPLGARWVEFMPRAIAPRVRYFAALLADVALSVLMLLIVLHADPPPANGNRRPLSALGVVGLCWSSAALWNAVELLRQTIARHDVERRRHDALWMQRRDTQEQSRHLEARLTSVAAKRSEGHPELRVPPMVPFFGDHVWVFSAQKGEWIKRSAPLVCLCSCAQRLGRTLASTFMRGMRWLSYGLSAPSFAMQFSDTARALLGVPVFFFSVVGTSMHVAGSVNAPIALGWSSVLIWLWHLRALLLSSTFAPLLLMVGHCIADVVKWISILVWVIGAFALGFWLIFHDVTDAICPGNDAGDLADLNVIFGSLVGANLTVFNLPGEPVTYSIFHAVFTLVETVLNGETTLSCLGQSPHPVSATMLMVLFQFAALFLLVNMLIALVTFTFTSIYESQEVNFLFTRASIFLSYDANHPPPPLNLLSIPYHTLSWLVSLVKSARRILLGERRKRTPAQKELRSAGSWLVHEQPWWKDWQRSESGERLADAVAQYATLHEHEELEEGRWRARFAQKLSVHSSRLQDAFNRGQASANAELQRLSRSQELLVRRLDEVLASQVGTGVGEEGGASSHPPMHPRMLSGNRSMSSMSARRLLHLELRRGMSSSSVLAVQQQQQQQQQGSPSTNKPASVRDGDQHDTYQRMLANTLLDPPPARPPSRQRSAANVASHKMSTRRSAADAAESASRHIGDGAPQSSRSSAAGTVRRLIKLLESSGGGDDRRHMGSGVETIDESSTGAKGVVSPSLPSSAPSLSFPSSSHPSSPEWSLTRRPWQSATVKLVVVQAAWRGSAARRAAARLRGALEEAEPGAPPPAPAPAPAPAAPPELDRALSGRI